MSSTSFERDESSAPPSSVHPTRTGSFSLSFLLSHEQAQGQEEEGGTIRSRESVSPLLPLDSKALLLLFESGTSLISCGARALLLRKGWQGLDVHFGLLGLCTE